MRVLFLWFCWSALFTSTLAFADSKATPLRILTFNIERNHDVGHEKSEMLAVANTFDSAPDEKPDFILLQEVYRLNSQRPEELTAAHFLASILGEPNYEVQFYPKSGVITSDEGCATLSRSAPLDSSVLRMSSVPLFDSQRMAIFSMHDLPGVGKARVINSHLAYAEWMHDARASQMRKILDQLAKLQDDPTTRADLIIWGGDFNSEYDPVQWPEVQVLNDPKSNHGILFRSHNDIRNKTQGKDPRVPKYRVDNIFVATASPDITLTFVNERILWKDGMPVLGGAREYFSDHLGVLQTFSVERKQTILGKKPSDERPSLIQRARKPRHSPNGEQSAR